MAARSNINGLSVFDPEARYAALDERVSNVRTSLNNFEQTVTQNFQTLNATLASLSLEVRSNQRTPWGVIWSAIGVFITFVVVIGGLAYWPIRENTGRLEDAMILVTQVLNDTIIALPDKFITRTETERLAQRASEEREATRNALTALQLEKLNRSEWMLRNNLVDRAIDDVFLRIDPQLAEDRRRIERIEDALFAPAFNLPRR